MHLNAQKYQSERIGIFSGEGGRIRFSAEKPRVGKQSTGLFAWTALSNPPSIQKVQHQMVLDFSWQYGTLINIVANSEEFANET